MGWGGLLQYHRENYRFKKAKIYNRNYDSEGYLLRQPCGVDGESQKFTHYVNIEVMNNGIEVIVDLDRLVNERYSYANRGPRPQSDESMPGSTALMVVTLAASAFAAYQYQDKIREVIKNFEGFKMS